MQSTQFLKLTTANQGIRSKFPSTKPLQICIVPLKPQTSTTKFPLILDEHNHLSDKNISLELL